MNPEDITTQRLSNQHITHHRWQTPAELITWMGAIQAQDFAGAKWSLGLRLPTTTEAEIDQAIAAGSLIRTWPMRGTLHFVPAADARWMLDLLTPRILAGGAARNRQLELDEATFGRSRDLFQAALQGGQCLTRPAMLALLEQAQIATGGQRGYHILGRHAQEGLICFGPPQGSQQTFVLLNEWAPQACRLEHDQALAELTLRYFSSRGPATLADFVWWSGLKISDARAGLAAVAAHLVKETINGQTCWYAPGLTLPPRSSPQGFLLPGFDEYLLGYTDRSASLAVEHARIVCPGGNGMFMPTIVIDGRVRGTWRRTIKKERVEIVLQPFNELTRAEKETVALAAARYGAYLGLAVKLTPDVSPL